MQRRIDEIQRELAALPARRAWDKGVKSYAEELFDDYLDRYDLKAAERIGKLTEADLLRGAKDWSQFSYGGCAEVCDEDICARLCSKSEIKRTNNGEKRLNPDDDWMEVQARALKQAAQFVLNAVNRRDTKC